MSRNGLIIDWERFKESVMDYFRPSKYEDSQGTLSKLLQLDTVEEYQEVDLYVLPRKGPDIVLGIQCLQNLGKVTYDYLNQTMKFSWSGRDYGLKVEEQKVIPVRQVLVKWSGRPPEEVTREWLSEFQEAYPFYHLEDKVIYEGEKNVTPSPREPRRSMRARSKPAWQKDYAM
ncbi:hypothetical protein Tco_1195119 [Tanacetum coccineum]